MNKKADLKVVVYAILVLAFLVLSLMIGSLVGQTGEEAADSLWFFQKGFKPFDFEKPVTADDTIVDDSVNALMCGIKITAAMDTHRRCYLMYNDDNLYGCKVGGRYITISTPDARLASSKCADMSGILILRSDPNFARCLPEECRDTTDFIKDGKLVLDITNYLDQCKDAKIYTGDDTEACKKGDIKVGSRCLSCSASAQGNIGSEQWFSRCEIRDFQLPQRGIEDSTLEKWIAGFGDPEYILYYEKFPEGEDAYWQADRWGFAPIIMYAAAVGSGVLPLSDDINNAIKIGKTGDVFKAVTDSSLLGKAANALLKNSQSVFRHFFKESVEGIITKKLIKETMIVSEGALLNPANIDNYMDIVSKHISQGKYLSKSNADDIAEDLIPLLKKDISGYANDEGSDIIRSINARKQIAEAKEDIARKTGRDISEVTDEEAIEEVALTQAMSIGAEIDYVMSINKNTEMLTLLRRKESTTAFLKGFFDDTGKLDSAGLEKFVKNHKNNIDAFEELIISGKLSDEEAELLFDGVESVLYDADKVSKMTAPLSKVSDTTSSMTTAIGKIIPAEKILSIYDNVKNTRVIKSGVTIASWTGKIGTAALGNPEGQFATWWIVSYFGVMQDSINQKFVPAGINTIKVSKPSIFGVGQEYDLDIADSHMIALKDYIKAGDKDPRYRPLHLVSPCMANLTVQTTTFYASLKEEDALAYDLYDFGWGLTPVEKGTLYYEPIDTGLVSVSITTGEKLLDDANSLIKKGDYETALIMLEEFIEDHPDSTDALEASSFIDYILSNEEAVKEIGYERLNEIAFVEVVKPEQRAKIYSMFLKNLAYGDDSGVCATPEKYILQIEECDYITSEELKYGYFALAPVFYYDGYDAVQPVYDWSSYDFFNYYSTRTRLYENIISDYAMSMMYVNADDQADAEMMLDRYLKYADEVGYDKTKIVDWLVWGKIADNVAWLPMDAYLVGNIKIPKHIKNIRSSYYGNDISLIPDHDEYDSKIVDFNKDIESDTYFIDDTYEELMIKKMYYEDKIRVKDYLSESEQKKDLLNIWIKINSELMRFGNNINPSTAVKAIPPEDVSDSSDPLSGANLKFRGIYVDTEFGEGFEGENAKMYNYCYQGTKASREIVLPAVTSIGFFADELTGAAAGAGCAATGIGAAAAPFCARAAMVVTNLGLTFLEQKLNDDVKWPKHFGN